MKCPSARGNEVAGARRPFPGRERSWLRAGWRAGGSRTAPTRDAGEAMVLVLSHDDVCAAVTMADAVEAMERGFSEQAEGHVVQPQRLNSRAGKGWIRLGPAVLEDSGW